MPSVILFDPTETVVPVRGLGSEISEKPLQQPKISC